MADKFHRVVVTGMGAVTPIGNNAEQAYQNAKKGMCGIDYITCMDTSDYKTKLAGEVKNFDATQFMEKKEARRMDKFSQYAVVASYEAMAQSGLEVGENIDAYRIGVMVGSGIGGFSVLEREIIKLHTKGPDKVSPLFVPIVISNIAAGNISIKLGAKGTCYSPISACSTGAHSVGEAMRTIRHGYADAIIAGGCESAICGIGLAGFINMGALATTEQIDRASIPFDKERGGFVMGEGAAVLVLESLEHAQKRGAKILAEITGYGTTGDAYHITAPDPSGDGVRVCMEMAMNDAGLQKQQISYINAHGTGTPLNDLYETVAIKEAFGDYAYNIPVSSTKSMTGHLLGATGSFEVIMCVHSVMDDYILPTINLQVKDPELDLDYVPHQGREREVIHALSNSLGFGGHNATIIVSKYS